MTRVAVIGNLTLDLIHDYNSRKRYTSYGGPAYFVYKVLRVLGGEVIPIGFTPEGHPIRRLVDASCLMRDERYTVFELRYGRDGVRIAEPRQLAPEITVKDIKRCLDRKTVNAIIVSPVFNEVSVEVLVSTLKLKQSVPVAIDLQGFIRSKYIKDMEDLSSLLHALYESRRGIESSSITLAHASLDELKRIYEGDLEKLAEMVPYGEFYLVITLGEKGSVLISSRSISRIPVYGPFIGDPTGAGDIYLASMLLGCIEGYDVRVSAILGSVAAGLHVKGELHNKSKHDIVHEALKLAKKSLQLNWLHR